MLKLNLKYIPLVLTYLVFAPNPSFFSVNAQFDEIISSSTSKLSIPAASSSPFFEIFLPEEGVPIANSSTPKNSTPKSTAKQSVTKIKAPGKVIKDGYGLAFWDEKTGELNFKPKPPKNPTDLHSAIFVSDQKLKQPYEIGFTMITSRQLREEKPHSTEVGWFLFGYKGRDQFKYLVLKPNGYGMEMGELLPGNEIVYLFTTPRNLYDFPIGQRFEVIFRVKENLISVSVNGEQYFEYLMNKNDNLPPNGQFGFYSENAEVVVSNIKAKQL